MSVPDLFAGALACLAVAPAGARWLRVAQREHYLAGGVTRFAWRWWTATPGAAALAGVGAAGLVVSAFVPVAAAAAAVVVALGPPGLSPRGRTSKLAWTRRLRTLAGVAVALEVAVVLAGALTGAFAAGAAGAALGVPVLLDAALAVTAPLERALAGRHVAAAKERVRRVKPLIVGITGSYGKTSTKTYVAHLLEPFCSVVASPASFNNRAGLARTVNEHLRPGTEVLVAEMGAYGQGEIAELCRFLPPQISVITAIGPMHLERFGTLERTLAAKAEIIAGARTVVLATDGPHLSGLAERLLAAGRRVVRCSGLRPSDGGGGSDVAVSFRDLPDRKGVLEIFLEGKPVAEAEVDPEHRPAATSNVACALAVALDLGLSLEDLVPRLGSLPTPSNRLQVYQAQGGFTVIDDTFNSNPEGSKVALGLLSEEGAAGRRAVVTPGMVELGPKQFEENRTFATLATGSATDLVVVGRTNRRALLAGAETGSQMQVRVVDRLDQAVQWVRSNLGPGDAVLYENDLPDHFL